MKLRLILLLIISGALSLLAAITSASTITPWPTPELDRSQPTDSQRDFAYFFADIHHDSGVPFLLEDSVALLNAPQPQWAILKAQARNQFWSDAEIEEEWQRIKQNWETRLEVFVYARSLTAPGARLDLTGSVRRIVLETSSGYVEIVDRSSIETTSPTYREGRYEGILVLNFDRSLVLTPGTKWVRLYLMTALDRMYFEWLFEGDT